MSAPSPVELDQPETDEMERDVQAMHDYGLWATMEKQD